MKKSAKNPKGVISESVYRRRTDNTMAKKVQKDKQRSTNHTHKTKDHEEFYIVSTVCLNYIF